MSYWHKPNLWRDEDVPSSPNDEYWKDFIRGQKEMMNMELYILLRKEKMNKHIEIVRSYIKREYPPQPDSIAANNAEDALDRIEVEINTFKDVAHFHKEKADRLQPTELELECLRNLNYALGRRSEYWPGESVVSDYIKRLSVSSQDRLSDEV